MCIFIIQTKADVYNMNQKYFLKMFVLFCKLDQKNNFTTLCSDMLNMKKKKTSSNIFMCFLM